MPGTVGATLEIQIVKDNGRVVMSEGTERNYPCVSGLDESTCQSRTKYGVADKVCHQLRFDVLVIANQLAGNAGVIDENINWSVKGQYSVRKVVDARQRHQIQWVSMHHVADRHRQ